MGAIPRGVLCYFPSYVLMDKIMARWKTTLMHDRINDIKHIVVEPRGTSLSPSVYFSEIYYLYSTLYHLSGGAHACSKLSRC